MQHHDYTYIDTVCPLCESEIILRDNAREETYCTECGYIIQDNTLTLITDLISQYDIEERECKETK